MTGKFESTSSVSKTWTFFEEAWHEGNVPIMGPRTHGAWLGSCVFDGARTFEGVAPDLDLHCARVNKSATTMLLKPLVSTGRWIELAQEGVARFGKNAELYIRPMYWAESGVGGGVRFDPESTRWCLTIYEAPMPAPTGTSVTLSPFRRPSPESAPTLAKAGCLYPNNSRAMIEAYGRGFDNCLLRDLNGNIAELANANVFMAKEGVVYTPLPNGTFLDGITRQRIIALLRDAGVAVIETTLTYADFEAAEEIFASGNYSKVTPVIRIDESHLPIGPMYRLARELYWSFAHGCTSGRAKPGREFLSVARGSKSTASV